MALTTVIAYDVHDDRRRARLAALLQQYGDRIQFSVFLCWLDETELAGVLEHGTEIIDPATDSIYAFRQCEPCWDKVVTIGQARPPLPTLYWAVL